MNAPDERTVTARLALSTAWALVAALQFGFHISSLNALQSPMSCDDGPPRAGVLGLPTCFEMTENAFGVLTTAYAVGGLFGSLRAGHLAAFRGRRGATTLAASVLIGGTVLSAAAPSYALLLLGRFVSGLACGVFTVVVPIYLAETAPAAIRGSVGVLNQLSVSGGIFVAVALAIPLGGAGAWRISPLVSAGLAVLQMVSAPLVIESPVWLAHQDAADPLLVGAAAAAASVDDDRAGASDPLLPSAKSERALSVTDILRSSDPRTRRGLWIVLLAFISQQTSGVRWQSMFFSTRIIEPVMPASAALISLVITFSGFALTLAPVFLIERVGRRALFAFSSVGMIVSSFVLNYALNTNVGVLSAVALFADVAFFSFGLGPIPFVLIAEVVPSHAAGAAGSIGLGVNWLLTIAVGVLFAPMRHAIGDGNVFSVFGVTTAVLTVLILALYKG